MRENLVQISIMSSTRIKQISIMSSTHINSPMWERRGLLSIAIGSTLVSISVEQSSTIQPHGHWVESRRAQAYA